MSHPASPFQLALATYGLLLIECAGALVLTVVGIAAIYASQCRRDVPKRITMLYVLKHWSQRLLERRQSSGGRRWMQNLMPDSSTRGSVLREDPRELPRPPRKASHCRRSLLGCYTNEACEDEENDAAESQLDSNRANCTCSNCKTLPTLAECAICFEPLQCQRIESCVTCANLTCGNCASRLSSCAFCRSKLPTQRNRAIERFLNKLDLPCRNSRYGCFAVVNGENRIDHEAVCSYTAINCPIGRRACSWRGSVLEIAQHFRKAHELLPVSDHAIAVNIYNFREKAYARDGRQYTACLSCYNQLFVVKVILFHGKLKLLFSHLGYTCHVDEKQSSLRYGIWINISAEDRHLRGVLLFGKADRGTREVEIASDSFCSKAKTSDPEDLVKIEILIKQIKAT